MGDFKSHYALQTRLSRKSLQKFLPPHNLHFFLTLKVEKQQPSNETLSSPSSKQVKKIYIVFFNVLYFIFGKDVIKERASDRPVQAGAEFFVRPIGCKGQRGLWRTKVLQARA